MDQSMRQPLSTFDVIHSSNMWTQTVLSCAKHSTTMQILIVSRLWFCGRPWRLEINIRRNSVYFRKSRVRANKLDVQETNFSFAQFNRIRIHFLGRRITVGRYTRTWSMGFCDWSFFIPHETKPTKPKMQESHGETCRHLLNWTGENKAQPRTPISIWSTLITFHQTKHNLVSMLCNRSLRIMKPWLWW